MELFVSGLFNRGQENEFVELEAAAKCSLDGLMLLRYAYGKNGLPIQSETKVFLFPDINLRRGNLVRVFTFSHHSKKKEKDEKLGKTVFNFSWNLDRTIWEGKCVEANIFEPHCSMGMSPDDDLADTIRSNDVDEHAALMGEDSLKANLLMAALEGRFSVIGKDGKTAPVRVTDVPQKVKDAVEAKDLDKAYALLIAEGAR